MFTGGSLKCCKMNSMCLHILLFWRERERPEYLDSRTLGMLNWIEPNFYHYLLHFMQFLAPKFTDFDYHLDT